jgi:hypothetical protein
MTMAETNPEVDLDTEYQDALLLAAQGDAAAKKRVEAIEGEMARQATEARRAEALAAAQARKAVEEEEARRQAEQEAERARRQAAAEKLEVARRKFRELSKEWSLTADEVMTLGCEARNASLHGECAEALRSAVLRYGSLPWKRRLLSELGSWPRPAARGGTAGGSISSIVEGA